MPDLTLHIVLGKTEEEFEAMMQEAFAKGEGVGITNDPDYHDHPLFGLTHLHDQGRRPHGHRPVVDWDTTPIFVGDDKP